MSSIEKVWPELKHHSCALHNREVHTGAVHQAKGSDDAEVQPGRPLLLCLKFQSNCLTARAVQVTSLRFCGAKWGLDDKQGLHVQAHVVGLKGVEYMDSLQDKKRLTEQGDSITFSEELDRIYLSTPDTLEVCPAQLLPATSLQTSWQAVHSSELGSLRACRLKYFACSTHSEATGWRDKILRAGIPHVRFCSLQTQACQPLIAGILCMRSSMHAFTSLLQVVDEGKKRAIQIEKEGFPDAVVWNPWIKKAAGMADFGDDEYKVKSLSSVTCSIDVI